MTGPGLREHMTQMPTACMQCMQSYASHLHECFERDIIGIYAHLKAQHTRAHRRAHTQHHDVVCFLMRACVCAALTSFTEAST